MGIIRAYNSLFMLIYKILAEGPALPVKKNVEFFLKTKKNSPREPLSFHKKFQSIRSSRLAGYREPNVLFYFIDN